MDNKRFTLVLLGIALVAILLFGAWKLALGKPKLAATQPATSQTEPQQTTNSYTTGEVAQHSTKSDCWTIISGSVYNLTSYVSSHPGGDEILLACGKDGTTLFMSRTTSSGESVGSGTAHSSSAQAQLEQLKIGIVKD